jgi:KilA-N domain
MLRQVNLSVIAMTAVHGTTEMLKARDGDFFISNWLRNRNTVELLGIWETVYNPAFNYGEFAAIKSQAGLNSYKISVKEWVERTHAIGLQATGVQSSTKKPLMSAT